MLAAIVAPFLLTRATFSRFRSLRARAGVDKLQPKSRSANQRQPRFPNPTLAFERSRRDCWYRSSCRGTATPTHSRNGKDREQSNGHEAEHRRFHFVRLVENLGSALFGQLPVLPYAAMAVGLFYLGHRPWVLVRESRPRKRGRMAASASAANCKCSRRGVALRNVS